MMRRRARRALQRLARSGSAPETAPRRIDAGAIAGDLLDAIERGGLGLSFQPIVAVGGAACRRVEALVRWRHPVYGNLDPRDIVRSAAGAGLLVPLAEWVIAAAARERALWAEDGLELDLSVNLAGEELREGGAQALVRAIERARLRPSAFTFEVRAAAATDDAIRDGMSVLSLGGARVALDDVSVADVPSRRLAVEIDELKLSRSMVMRAVADESAKTALRSFVELARDLGLTTVAVGVEDAPTWGLITRVKCDLAQGYWASRPLATVEIPPWHRWAARLALTGGAALVSTAGLARVAEAAPRAAAAEVTTGPAAASACCAVRSLPAAAPVLDIATTTVEQGGVRVVVEAGLGDDLARAIAATAERDRGAVESSLRAQLARTPTVYVLASRGSFAHVLERSFGQSAVAASALAAGHGGVAFPDRGAIVLNWHNVGAGSLTIVRHELTHLLVHQLAGDAEIPAWLDEGLATLAEREAAADPIADARDAATTLALLDRGATSLTALAAARDWALTDAGLRGQSYAFSAEAVRMLKSRVGGDALTRLLVGSRTSGFATSFEAVAGMSLADFERSFPAEESRSRAGLRVVEGGGGENVRWAVLGVAAGTSVHVTIAGVAYHVEFDVTVGDGGVYEAVFGSTAPAGEYALTAVAGTARATAILDVR